MATLHKIRLHPSTHDYYVEKGDGSRVLYKGMCWTIEREEGSICLRDPEVVGTFLGHLSEDQRVTLILGEPKEGMWEYVFRPSSFDFL